MGQKVIVVQAFNKLDTLESLCQSLLRCDGRQDYSLLFWVDAPQGSRHPTLYGQQQQQVLTYLNHFLSQFRSEFRQIDLHLNIFNKGTCKTCQIAVTHGLLDHDFAIFTEDDTLFSRDSLLFFEEAARSEDFKNPDCWAIAGESVFFDSRNSLVSSELLSQAQAYAREESLSRYYTQHAFLPSTCFATTREKWEQFSETRGQPRGDEDVCLRCRKEGKYALFPILSRVRDTGMHHPHGYSVSMVGKPSITNKTNFLSSDDLIPLPQNPPLRPYGGNLDSLYFSSSLLHGFRPSLPQIPPTPPDAKFTPIVSLGGDCQVAWQLEQVFSHPIPSPFDWVVTPFLSLVPILQNRGKEIALAVHTLEALEPFAAEAAQCSLTGLTFQHDFDRDSGSQVLLTRAAIDSCRSKMTHKMQRFLDVVARHPVVHFVRLGTYRDPAFAWTYLKEARPLKHSEVNSLVGQLATTFPQVEVHLLLVLYRDVSPLEDDSPLAQAVEVHYLDTPEKPTWEGDPIPWTQLLTDYKRSHFLGSTQEPSIEDLRYQIHRAVEKGRGATHRTTEEQMDLWKKVLSLDPNHAEAMINIALLAHRLGEKEQALESIERARILAPENPFGQLVAAYIYQAGGRQNEALALLDGILSQPDAPPWLLKNALIAKGN